MTNLSGASVIRVLQQFFKDGGVARVSFQQAVDAGRQLLVLPEHFTELVLDTQKQKVCRAGTAVTVRCWRRFSVFLPEKVY